MRSWADPVGRRRARRDSRRRDARLFFGDAGGAAGRARLRGERFGPARAGRDRERGARTPDRANRQRGGADLLSLSGHDAARRHRRSGGGHPARRARPAGAPGTVRAARAGAVRIDDVRGASGRRSGQRHHRPEGADPRRRSGPGDLSRGHRRGSGGAVAGRAPVHAGAADRVRAAGGGPGGDRHLRRDQRRDHAADAGIRAAHGARGGAARFSGWCCATAPAWRRPG